jgi:peptidoglycan/xylan/chitin deacetylase (PgdA/CDA1 family)
MSIKHKSFIRAAVITVTAVMLTVGAAVQIRDSAQPAGSVAVPILMYHSVSSDESAASKYTVTAAEFDSDMKWLHDNGYHAVFISQLVDYVENGAQLPDKPVCITLDDGYEDNLTNMLPIIEKYGFKATVSVIGSCSFDDRPGRYHLDLADIGQLVKSGRVEIGSHTFNMHFNENGKRRGCKRMIGESEKEYAAALTEDLRKNQELMTDKCGVTPEVFTYPYGQISPESLPIVKTVGFQAALTVKPGMNYLVRGDAGQLYSLKRFNRPSGISTEKFMKRTVE